MKNINGFRLRENTDVMPPSNTSLCSGMLVVPAFQSICFALMLFVFGGDIGMQIVGKAPVSWIGTAISIACILVNGFFLFKRSRWLQST